MSKQEWVYTLVRAIDALGGEATDYELAKSDFVIKEQNPKLKDPPASVRGAIHDYSSDHTRGREAGARNGNARDVFQKTASATWKIRNHENPYVVQALEGIEDSGIIESTFGSER